MTDVWNNAKHEPGQKTTSGLFQAMPHHEFVYQNQLVNNNLID